jgi:hypothetical protein
LKYQILQKRKTKYHYKKTERKYQIAETERKYQIAETEEKTKYQTIAETEQKYQIAEAKESKINVQILILQPQAQNLIFILYLLIGQTTHI